MMFDDSLRQLQEKLARKKHLQPIQKELMRQSIDLTRRVDELEKLLVSADL